MHSPDPRASYEITDNLKETFRSYRLLFGQSKASRVIFRCLHRDNPKLSRSGDRLLYKICAQTPFEDVDVPTDRPVYYAERKIPYFRRKDQANCKGIESCQTEKLERIATGPSRHIAILDVLASCDIWLPQHYTYLDTGCLDTPDTQVT